MKPTRNKMPSLTIYDIKRLSEDKAPYFFSCDSLKFFGQTMRSFSVYKNKELGKYYISAPMRDRSGKRVGTTERYFNPETNELENV